MSDLTPVSNKVKKSKFKFFHPNVVIIIKIAALSMCVLTAARLIFLLKYLLFFRGVSFSNIVLSLLNGVRFDLSTTFLLYTIIFIALILPGRWSVSKIYLGIIKHLIFLFFVAVILVLAVDITYYRFANHHLAFELVTTVAHDVVPMIKIIFTQYIPYVFVLIIFYAVVYTALGKIVRQPDGRAFHFKNTVLAVSAHTGRFIVNFVILAAVAVVSIRGGLQPKPLRTSYAFINDKIVLGHLALNGVYTTFQAMYKSKKPMEVPYNYDTAAENMRELLSDEKNRFLDKDFPLFRENLEKRAEKGTPANVVIFILESWSGDEIGVLSTKHSVTPNFDKLARDGLLLSNCFSVGQRSTDAVMSVLMSFPSSAASDAIGKVYEQNPMIGIGNILKKKGYSTLFICGAKRGSMGFDAFAKKAGFDRYIAKDDFDTLPEKSFDGTWGVFDQYAFERANEEFSKIKKPFLAVLYTLNPHAPYKVPSEKFRKYKSGENAPFLNALYYSDWTLGRFFELAKKSAYFKNTLFVIVGDHPEGHHEKGIYDHFRIPCLFYFPGKILPCVNDGAASQTAILPSITDFLNIDAKHSSFGKSIFRKNSDFAMIGYGDIFGWFRGDFIYLRSVDKPVGFYNWRKDHFFENDLLGKNPQMQKKYERDLMSAMKISTELLYRNKIAPLK